MGDWIAGYAEYAGGLVEMLKFRAQKLHQAHVYPLGALTVGLKGEAITEMVELTEAGCIGFSQADNPIIDTRTRREVARVKVGKSPKRLLAVTTP